MALSKLDNLYRQVILGHSQHPHHHGHLKMADHEIELRNPTCGDVLQLELVLEDDQISQIAFSGEGCTISQASASMMTDAVLHKTPVQAEAMIERFSDMMIGDRDEDWSLLEDAAILQGVQQFPARIKCATLAWKALHKALKSDDQRATTGQIMNHAETEETNE